jgi:hypothetical protein
MGTGAVSRVIIVQEAKAYVHCISRGSRQEIKLDATRGRDVGAVLVATIKISIAGSVK